MIGRNTPLRGRPQPGGIRMPGNTRVASPPSPLWRDMANDLDGNKVDIHGQVACTYDLVPAAYDEPNTQNCDGGSPSFDLHHGVDDYSSLQSLIRWSVERWTLPGILHDSLPCASAKV